MSRMRITSDRAEVSFRRGESMESPDVTTGFGNVDQTADPQSFIHFVDEANAQADAQDCKRKMLALLGAQEGHRILDVGCGTGDDARVLAQMVGAMGRVVGIDNSEAMLAEARRRAAGLRLPLDHLFGEAHRLDFADDTFDGCRSERTLMHLDDPRRAIAEMVRVARPGGSIVVFDFDWDAVMIDSPDRSLTRRVVHLMSDRIRHGWIGRQLPGLFRDAGLIDVTIIPHTIMVSFSFFIRIIGAGLTDAQESGAVSATAAADWWEHLEAAARRGRFFAAFPGFIVGGRKA